MGKPSLLAAFCALEKSRTAITTCQSPEAASALAAFRPRPEEAPVMMTVGFCRPMLPEDADAVAGRSSVAEPAWATTDARTACCALEDAAGCS